MKFYDLLIEKGKEEGIIKNVVGAIVLNEKNEVLIMSRKKDDFMGGIDELPSGNMKSGEKVYVAFSVILFISSKVAIESSYSTLTLYLLIDG